MTVPPTSFPEPGQPGNWATQLTNAIKDRDAIIKDLAEGRVTPAQLASAMDQLQDSLMGTIATEVQAPARQAATEYIAEQGEVVDAAATRAVTVAADPAIAGALATPGSATRAEATALIVSDRPVAVDDFIEPGDTDDGPAFRRAAAAATRVILKARTYIVTPVTMPSGHRVVIPHTHGVHWTGEGKGATVVKVGPGAGNYHSIFGANTGATDPAAALMADLTGLSLSGFTIDQNATDNPVTSHANNLAASGGVGRGRIGVAAHRGTGIRVADVEFRDFQSIWCVQILGQNVADATVDRCDFHGIGHPTVNWDHTSIYLDSAGGTVRDCTFKARAYAARQPFELHGSRMTARGNRVEGYVYGMDITGSIWHGPGSGIASDNEFLGVASGLDIWTGANYGVVGQYGIDGFTYSNNLVTTDHARFGGTWYVGMVSLNGGASLPLRALKIVGNTYRLDTLGTPDTIDQYSQVVSLARGVPVQPVTGGTNADVDITVTGNTVEGSVAGFFRYVNTGGTIDGLRITDNQVRNIGRAGAAAYDGSRNSAVLLETGTVRNARHTGNTYIDTHPTTRGINRGSYYVIGAAESIFDDGSRINVADGSLPSLVTLTGAATGRLSWQGSVPRFNAGGHNAAKFVHGSRVVDEHSGTTYVNIADTWTPV